MATTKPAPAKAPKTVEERKKADDLVVRIARTTIQYDGEEYLPGDEIALTAAQAASLDQVSALEPIAS